LKVFSTRLSREFEEIILVPIADSHDSDAFADEKYVEERVKLIQNTPNAFALLNGDLMNMATKNSKSDVYADKYSPDEQLDRCIERYYPIRDKILGINEGNHERRISRDTGIQVTKRFARELGIEDRYSPDGLYIILRAGQVRNKLRESNGSGRIRQICYTIYMTHGARSGRKAGGKINALIELSNIVAADIYIHSHSHLGAIIPGVINVPDLRNDKIKVNDTLYINTAASLDYGGYGEIGEYHPVSKKSPIIYLCGTRKAIDADLGERMKWLD
jgi:hypothetical protein